MKKTSILIFFTIQLFLNSCNLANLPKDENTLSLSSKTTDLLNHDFTVIDAKFLGLLTYAEKSYAWRQKANSLHQRIDKFLKQNNGQIASRDLLDMHHLSQDYLNNIRAPLVDLMHSPFYSMDYKKIIEIELNKKTYIESGAWSTRTALSNHNDLFDEDSPDKIKVDVFHINPSDREGQSFLRNFKISFAASLLLLDNYSLGLDPFLKNKTLRRSLFYDAPDSHKDDSESLKEIWDTLNKKEGPPYQLVQAYGLYQNIQGAAQENDTSPQSPYLEELESLIGHSNTLHVMKDNQGRKISLQDINKTSRHYSSRTKDRLFRIRNSTTHLVSKVFGNSAGLFQTRKGKLHGLPSKEVQSLAGKIQALDILLEKTPFRLTDKFIPGHYGHVAIWAGTEKELRDLDVWDSLPQLYEAAKTNYSYAGPGFQEAIRDGRHIIEALRPGVQINTMQHFLNIDDLAVIRPRYCAGPTGTSCLNPADKRHYLIEAFKQIGKDYDFNFDVNTRNRIVCSEIAYRTYFNLDFKTTRTLGNYSISPDQVAIQADEATDPFYPVLLYFDGRQISGEVKLKRKVIRLLLNKDYRAVAEIAGIRLE
jgi:hypothetical protein